MNKPGQDVCGTYILVLRLDADKTISIGRLGSFLFPVGYYTYVGSAHGPGGLRARLRHHLWPTPQPHWHIDYLRAEATLVQRWIRGDGSRREHDWAALLASLPGASVPAPRFGASDCKCDTHLHHCPDAPKPGEFQTLVQRRFPDDPPIIVFDV